ncbi:MAG: hypothetical protein LBI62_06015, partial [Candidatus Accumulibacter sp.]|nr:hypothetical protein [Accumulibacter sp.]
MAAAGCGEFISLPGEREGAAPLPENKRRKNLSVDLTPTLVVAISATALFDLSEADSVFRA